MEQHVGGLVAEIGKESTVIVPLVEQSNRPRIDGLVNPPSLVDIKLDQIFLPLALLIAEVPSNMSIR